MDARLSRSTTAWKWLRCHPYTAGSALLLLGLFFPFLFRSDAEWEEVYIRAADYLRAGQNPYDSQGGYLYPPFMAWAAIPFSYLPFLAGRAAWWLVNVLGLIVVVRGAWRLAGGGRLEEKSGSPRAEHLAAWAGGACGFVYLQNCLAHRQTDVVAAGLLIGGCLALRRARAFWAATWFGLAAAMKCTPLLWAPYLAWRGRPIAAAWLVVVALAVNALPDLTHPATSGRPWLLEFHTRYLRPLTERDYIPGTWGSDIVYNQSLAGAANRWVLTRLVWGPDEGTLEARSASLSPAALRGLVLGVELLLVGAVLFACGRPFRHVEEGPDGASRAPLEYSVVFMLMLLLSPMSSKAHFGVLLLPGFLVARAVFHQGGRWAGLFFTGALLMTGLAIKDPLGQRLYTLCLWYGTVTWHTLFLLAGCLILLAQKPAASQTAALEDNQARAA